MATAKARTRTIKMITIKGTTIKVKFKAMVKFKAKVIATSSVVVKATMTSREAALTNYVPFLADCCFHSGYYNADGQQPYQHEDHQNGTYYDGGQQNYQDEYYNNQYYDQGAPAAGQQPQYHQNQGNGYGYVHWLLLLCTPIDRS